MTLKMLGLLLATLPAFALANDGNASDTLLTPNYRIKITELCQEGEVACNNVSYVGTHRKKGQSISLKGKSLVRLCADQKTPCENLGYEFRNGDIRYIVTSDALLLVKRGEQVLLREQGQWQE